MLNFIQIKKKRDSKNVMLLLRLLRMQKLFPRNVGGFTGRMRTNKSGNVYYNTYVVRIHKGDVETLKDSFKVVVKGFRIVCDFVHIPSQFHLNEKLQVSLFCLLAVGESVAAKELILFEESMLVEILCVEKEDLATPPDRVTASSRQSEKQRNTQVVCL